MRTNAEKQKLVDELQIKIDNLTAQMNQATADRNRLVRQLRKDQGSTTSSLSVTSPQVIERLKTFKDLKKYFILKDHGDHCINSMWSHLERNRIEKNKVSEQELIKYMDCVNSQMSDLREHCKRIFAAINQHCI